MSFSFLEQSPKFLLRIIIFIPFYLIFAIPSRISGWCVSYFQYSLSALRHAVNSLGLGDDYFYGSYLLHIYPAQKDSDLFWCICNSVTVIGIIIMWDWVFLNNNVHVGS